MRLPRGIVKKGRRYYARLYVKGGETWRPLGSDPDEAIAALYRLRVDQKEGGPIAGANGHADDPTLEEAGGRWLSERVEAEMESRNASMIRSRVERHLFRCLGPVPIRSLRRTDCHSYKAWLRKTRPELQPGTLRHYLRDLREILNWAEEVELIDVSPWPKRRLLPRVERRPPRRFSEKEVRALVSHPRAHGFAVRLLLSTGLRWGEACRATRRDIENGQLLVRRSKTGQPRRVPIPGALLAEIMRRGVDRLCPFGERSSGKFNETIRRMSGIKDFHAHACRHTFATRYLEHGGDLLVLQRLLGHSSAEMTQHYGRLGERHIRDDATRVFEAWDDRESDREGSAVST